MTYKGLCESIGPNFFGGAIMEWTKCRERLPSEDGRYLVVQNLFGRAQMIKVCSFSNDLYNVDEYDFPKKDYKNKAGWYGCDNETGYYEVASVTHWMPLPEYPKD